MGVVGFAAGGGLALWLGGEAGVATEMYVYPGAGSAFFDDSRPDTHVEDAARQAWIRTLEFLRKHLG